MRRERGSGGWEKKIKLCSSSKVPAPSRFPRAAGPRGELNGRSWPREGRRRPWRRDGRRRALRRSASKLIALPKRESDQGQHVHFLFNELLQSFFSLLFLSFFFSFFSSPCRLSQRSLARPPGRRRTRGAGAQRRSGSGGVLLEARRIDRERREKR